MLGSSLSHDTLVGSRRCGRVLELLATEDPRDPLTVEQEEIGVGYPSLLIRVDHEGVEGRPSGEFLLVMLVDRYDELDHCPLVTSLLDEFGIDHPFRVRGLHRAGWRLARGR